MAVQFPHAGDELFNGGLTNWPHTALLNYSNEKFMMYADGYYQAAALLVNQCVTQHGLNDVLIYPIVFLYRQYIELRLKEIIANINYCINYTKEFPTHHKIDLLWNEFLRLYKELGEDPANEDFSNTQRIIFELAAADPNSMAFRYPVGKNGDDIILQDRINIPNVGEVMARISSFLDAVSDEMTHYKDIANDMYSNM